MRSTDSIGQQIRLARQEAGLRQDDLAEAAAVAQSNLSKIERDLLKPTVETLCRLADALKADWSYDGRRIIFRRRMR